MTASKRISKRVDQILPRPQSKRTMKNSADRIVPIKGQNLPPQRSQATLKPRLDGSANRSTIANCLAISNFTETTKTIKSSWLEESIRANNQIKPIDRTDQGKSAKAKRLVLFIFKKSDDLGLQLEPLAKLHYRMPRVVFTAR